MYYLIKVVITAVMVVLVSEVSKRSSVIAGILASIPLLSFIAIFWMYYENKDLNVIIDFSRAIFWLVIPSLLFFVALPILLKRGFNFYLSMTISASVMILFYYLMVLILKRFNITI